MIGSQNSLPVKSIDVVHAEVHQEGIFQNTYYLTLTNGQINRFHLITGERNIHFFWSLDASGPITIQFYENCVASATAGLISATNLNRTLSSTSLSRSFSSSTIGTDGTLIMSKLIVGNTGGGSGINAITPESATVRSGTEFILKKYTNYQLKFTNVASANVDLSFDCEYYEEPN